MIALVAAVVALTNFALFASYPINVGAYDYPNYAVMIQKGVSNLIHASGYPAILHYLTSLGSISTTNQEPYFDGEWLNSIQGIHIALHLILYVFSSLLVYKNFGKIVAILKHMAISCYKM